VFWNLSWSLALFLCVVFGQLLCEEFLTSEDKYFPETVDGNPRQVQICEIYPPGNLQKIPYQGSLEDDFPF